MDDVEAADAGETHSPIPLEHSLPNVSKRRKHQLRTPSTFLSELGIKRHFDQEECNRLLVENGYLDQDGSPDSIAVNDIFFADRDIAHQMLAQDYERIISLLTALADLNDVIGSSFSICELGAGASIASLWLARLYPEARVVAVDHSPNALKFAKSLAEKAEVKNIEFVEAGYDFIPSLFPAQSFDFVFAASAVFVDDANVDYTRDLCDLGSEAAENLPSSVKSFGIACRHLVDANGVVFVNGRLNDWAHLCLLHSLKENSLGIDWSCTSADVVGEGPDEQIASISLFARPGRQDCLVAPWEQHCAIQLAAHWDDQFLQISSTNIGIYSQLLLGGSEIVETCVEWPDGRKARFSVATRCGMLGVFAKMNPPFQCAGFIQSYAALSEGLETLSRWVDEATEAGAVITSEKTNPDLPSPPGELAAC